MLWVHPGALLAVEGLGELLRVGQHADHAEARGAVGVVKDLRDDEKNQKLAVSCKYRVIIQVVPNLFLASLTVPF